jgi:2-polyprenyl-3-methyl-5-hydroxy-6-metoxy-1,4-benzoquinol methylase
MSRGIVGIDWTPEREVLAVEVERNLLGIREQLVRHDENMKAYILLAQCVPYWLQHRPAIVKAAEDQREMVKHAIDPDEYDTYYNENPNEQGFEQAYGIEPREAIDNIPRVKWLAERIAYLPADVRLIDLSANDGWMPQALKVKLPNLKPVNCMDLNASNITKANARKRKKDSGIGQVLHGNFMTGNRKSDYGAAVLFETIEHLPDPLKGLRIASSYVKDGGSLFVSTPLGAVEGGNLPEWDKVERKGHLWSFRPDEFFELCGEVGEVTERGLGADGVMLAQVVVS